MKKYDIIACNNPGLARLSKVMEGTFYLSFSRLKFFPYRMVYAIICFVVEYIALDYVKKKENEPGQKAA